MPIFNKFRFGAIILPLKTTTYNVLYYIACDYKENENTVLIFSDNCYEKVRKQKHIGNLTFSELSAVGGIVCFYNFDIIWKIKWIW